MSLEEVDNVTIRKYRKINRSKSSEQLYGNLSLNSSSSENMARSLDLSTYANLSFNYEEIREELGTLKLQFESAKTEIDNLVIENGELKAIIQHQQQQINTLKELCAGNPTTPKGQNISLRKKQNRLRTESFRGIPAYQQKLEEDSISLDLELETQSMDPNSVSKGDVKKNPITRIEIYPNGEQRSENNECSRKKEQDEELIAEELKQNDENVSNLDLESETHSDDPNSDSKDDVKKDPNTGIEIYANGEHIPDKNNYSRKKQHDEELIVEKLKHNDENMKSSSSTNQSQSFSKQTTSSPEYAHATTKRIWIFSTQQCSGLASALFNSRKYTTYEKYSIYAQIKSNASTEEVLRECCNAKFEKDDKIVLCVGENDSNPIKIVSELSHCLKIVKDVPIIVLGIVENKHLNENKLNEKMALFCKSYCNCHFLKITSGYNILNETCHKINFKIDCLDYESNYMCPKKIRARLLCCKPNPRKSLRSRSNKQKSILDYFIRRKSIVVIDNPKNEVSPDTVSTIVNDGDATFFRA